MAIMENVPQGQPAEGRSRRTVLFDDDDWADLQAVADDQERSPSFILRKLLAWWLGREGAELPERPGGAQR